MEGHVEKVKQLVGIPLVAMFKYGSQVYGTTTTNSDLDFIVVAETDEPYRSVETEEYDIHVYSIAEFQRLLDTQTMSAIEALNAPVFSTHEFTYVLDKKALRHYVSAKADNSYVKAKKKIIIPEDRDYKVAKKSLFHAFRLLDFGIQVAKNGKIVDFTSSNDLFKEIMALSQPDDDSEDTEHKRTWDEYHILFKKRFNALKSEFKKLAPK